ncbi:hypothetical protein AK830_g1 [Neonectria ditissima]|uniref:Peptidase S8/S53 domain-containing protein n=1 Tax=Neonectria ditissima TaxID=78410 RepID=A0A0P7BHD3_9HYPO|nr:hypothetical protein AK830_g1 [Neonectria ditissima]
MLFNGKDGLIRPKALLSLSDREKLGNSGVQQLDYASNHTYMGRYQKEDLENIRQVKAILYVDMYRTALNVTPCLKNVDANGLIEVDVALHLGVDSTNLDLPTLVSENSNRPIDQIQFLPNKARLTVRGRNLDNVASIDDVHHIEDPVFGPVPQQTYQRKGQVIADAESGLDQGDHKPLHPAFKNRVVRWFGHTTADQMGHTAPTPVARLQASLCRASVIPVSGAVCDSNRSHDALQAPDASGFTQMNYNTAAEAIDEFGRKRFEMVICFAAGHLGENRVNPPNKRHIESEAEAKSCTTVGASENFPHIDNTATFSSQGPVIDGRPKPEDVVAPGSNIISAESTLVHDSKYPGTGVAILVNCRFSPTAALIKALLINGADILETVGTNSLPKDVNQSGFGRVNIANALVVVHGEARTGFREPKLHGTSVDGSEEIITVDQGQTTPKATLV